MNESRVHAVVSTVGLEGQGVREGFSAGMEQAQGSWIKGPGRQNPKLQELGC